MLLFKRLQCRMQIKNRRGENEIVPLKGTKPVTDVFLLLSAFVKFLDCIRHSNI